jgi:3-oxosteroid 1-dehydrogenase
MPGRNWDVVIIGAGASGLLAAVAARRLGFDVLLLESDGLIGGDTATASGQMWLPATHLATKIGVPDSEEAAAGYLDNILGSGTEASSPARRLAFARTGPKLARWLAYSNLPLNVSRGVPDYHPAAVGGLPEGRVVVTEPSDRRSLGEWSALLRSKRPPGAAGQLTSLVRQFTHSEGATATGGEALVAELLRRATVSGVEIWLGAEILGMTTAKDGVSGVRISRNGTELTVSATAGVLLAAGGFAGSQKLREEYLPLPTDVSWSLMGQNTGKLLRMCLELGAVPAAMSDAWWTPVTMIDGRAYSLEAARKAPHSVIVDQAGDRFCDEAAPGAELVRRAFENIRGVRTVPSYLIMDSRHRKNTALGPWAAGELPPAGASDIIRAKTLNELAVALGIDRAGLIGTMVRFNGFAHRGEDTDFHRGESVWDRYELAPGKRGRKLASLGKVDKKPFWAVRVYPGDQGTKGGLLVDEHSQVLREDGSPIGGLYACGGAAASRMKGTSPGPGAGLSEALVGAYLAVLHIDREIRGKS